MRVRSAARPAGWWSAVYTIHPAHYVRDEVERMEAAQRRQAANTFGAVCEQWLRRDEAKLASGTMKQRRRELDTDVLPSLGSRPIVGLRKDELTKLLQTIEQRAPEVARNVRQYLAGLFDYAVEAGLIAGSPVPGPKALKPRNQKPHAALPIDRVGDFLRVVDADSCTLQTRIAVRLLLMTAVRKQELIAAKWEEFDLERGEWQIPPQRMKVREPHWVPLSQAGRQVVARSSQALIR